MNKRYSWATLAPLIVILSFACTPAVYTQTNPGGLDISGELIKYGEPETHLVILSIKRRDHALAWKAEFEDGTDENIVAEDIPGLTVLKWKVDKERMKTLTIKPYKLRIYNGGVAFATTVSFNSAGRDFSGQLLANVIAHLIAGR